MEEKSCGCIPFCRNKHGGLRYLLVLRNKGYWEFPKGKQEEGESDIETAKRELREETGLTAEPDTTYVFEANYVFERRGETVHKKVLLYTCLVHDADSVHIDENEVVAYEWLDYATARARMNYTEMRELTDKVHQLLSEIKD